MLSNILIELLLHWLSFLPGLILFTLLICGISLLNIFLWVPLLIYFIYIQVKLPTFKEIDYWTELRESLGDSVYLKSDNYNNVFQAEFECNPNPNLNPNPNPNPNPTSNTLVTSGQVRKISIRPAASTRRNRSKL